MDNLNTMTTGLSAVTGGAHAAALFASFTMNEGGGVVINTALFAYATQAPGRGTCIFLAGIVAPLTVTEPIDVVMGRLYRPIEEATQLVGGLKSGNWASIYKAKAS